MTRAALYARYSSDLQSNRSIVDQFRLLDEKAKARGYAVVGHYSDAAISGGSITNRPGLIDILQAATSGHFDVLLTEALDRVSRDQEDIAHIFKRLNFHDIFIETLSEGRISTLHIGLKGTMNALYLEELANKTKRGMVGAVRAGRIAGGLSYGYETVHKLDDKGEPVRGLRRIREDQGDW